MTAAKEKLSKCGHFLPPFFKRPIRRTRFVVGCCCFVRARKKNCAANKKKYFFLDQQLAIFAGSMIGLVMGFAMEKSKVMLPIAIRSQMAFASMLMLQVFMAGAVTGTLSAAVLSWFGVKRSSQATALGFSVMSGYGANILGGLVMGAGMVLGGSCPGGAFAALGAGHWTGLAVILGGIFGAACFAHFQKWAKARMGERFHSKSSSKLIDEAVGKSQTLVAILFAIIGVCFVFVLNSYYPWRIDVEAMYVPGAVVVKNVDLTNDIYSLRSDVWPPYLSGAIIGLLQLPTFLILERFLGASSCYVTMACSAESSITSKDASETFPYYRGFFSFSDFAQLGIVVGLASGAFLSKALSNTHGIYVYSPPFTLLSGFHYFAGGAILLFGARLAGGCASGHGLSGMAQLSVASLLTVAGMFGGGILAAPFVANFVN